MACVEMQPENMESEREEGEIVDELDDLSDISSEEEFLLRQRLEILENYNNVLERKEAKRSSIGPGKSNKTKPSFWQDFTKVTDAKNDSNIQEVFRVTRTEKYLKKTKKPKEQLKDTVPLKNVKKKYTRSKKVQPMKVLSESSEDSEDDEYKNKRRKLADAVTLNKNKVDTSSLKDRLAKMLNPNTTSAESFIIKSSIILTGQSTATENPNLKPNSEFLSSNSNVKENINENPIVLSDLIDTDDSVQVIENVGEDSHDTVDAGIEQQKQVVHPDGNGDRDSTDDDLESLRQHALKTKSSKLKISLPDVQNTVPNKPDSEDEDSDTAELRMICLRSALLKKAIEMKKKQKLQKRLSQHSIVQDELLEKYNNDRNDTENNTDVEYVDMEIGSDGDEKSKDGCDNNNILDEFDPKTLKKNSCSAKVTKDETEEDEDLLRAKLLTSLSKNLPNLVDIKSLSTTATAKEVSNKPKTEKIKNITVPEEKKFIIKLGDSDSEGEHEATKNLTKMHMKLAEQTEFQLKLDQFLKSTRMEVEKNTLPDVVQPQVPPKPPQKFVPKAMNHLPKSEQIEYKNLVKRMAELEKLKQARQLSLNNLNKPSSKETLKPRNNSANTTQISAKKLEEKIAMSRKLIAEESAKMLKLKEEATKLSQRYKIVSNELRNITTAITLNKKQQRNVQNGLSKIRLQHQMLLKSSTTLKHSTLPNPPPSTVNNKVLNSNKKQKENDPSMKEHKNPNILKSVKVSVVNDLNKDTLINNPRLSIELDVSSNKKVVKAKTPTKDRLVDIKKTDQHIHETDERINANVEFKSNRKVEDGSQTESEVKDYISPLEALGRTERTKSIRNSMNARKVDGICVRTSRTGAAIWKEDPNAFLCPFEVGGTCKDTDCKFLHLQTK